MTAPLQTPTPSVDGNKPLAVLALGFRPFFLAAGLFAVVLMAAFVAGLPGVDSIQSHFSLPLWHGHEMIFGYAAAVVAGFLLTAVRNWTGKKTPTGGWLLLLLLIWLAGRVAGLFLPLWLSAVVDLLFLPLLAVAIFIPIRQSKQKHNLPVPLLLLLMAAGNALIHAELLGFAFGSVKQGLMISIAAVLMLISVIGGRVMPFFTERGLPGAKAVRRKWVESVATPAIAFWLLLEMIFPASLWTLLAALIAATVHLIRLAGWGNGGIRQAPMLWVIYLGYGWLVAGFILQGLAGIDLLSPTIALHGWTVGAIGMFTLGMMARVSLGHTGRPMVAHPAMIFAFVVLALVSLLRVMLPLLFPVATEAALWMAASGWILAFAVFVWIYAPYLVRPRADGQAG